ncbi:MULTISPECIES: LysR family transcriptional regulator [Providencia]|uniref:LysR family transcriptional regulator n=1 Tax=Providencia TaxID=586 RepID=UPI000D9C81AC|nr:MULTISPECIES: LysR family transcriptional regulator [Providencia]MTC57898.1 LysR family transcriptional regulator [Providencia rustigianii]SPY78025.1 Nodulation protein D 2 [Providencia rustigianii]
MNNLRKLDLNQLVTLSVLLRERHVSRAAEALYKSQPAVSHALNQLRELFQDPLLVRRDGQYQLTSKAESLCIPLNEALNQLDDLIAQKQFNPLSCQRHFNIAMSDYGAALIAVKLVPYLRKYAPDIDLKIWHCSREEMQNKLHEGSLDLAFGVFNTLDYSLRNQIVFTDKFVSIVDPQVCSQGKMDLVDWVSYPHILVSMKPFDANEIDHQLQLINQQRRIAVTVPYWQIAPQLLMGTNLILTLAQKAIPLSMSDKFTLFTPPLPLPDLVFQMIWHQRSDTDKAVYWLRETIVELLNEEGEFYYE